ncbi:ester cyclase [Halomarina rubra]|uniref:Ester cyclase n=1 Tax=Halomarina rubra TaxID=2071873 RepID=A0ABD6AUD1_9EURY|nr:ester cyclase [Halomarina rubra]
MAVTTRTNKEHIERFNREVFNGRNYDRIDELVTEDFVQHGAPGAGDIHGREAMKEYMMMLHSGFSDLESTVEAMVAEGDYVATRYTYRGTHDGEYMGIPPTDRPAEISGMVLSRVEDGKTAETWVEADMLGLLQQVGVVQMGERSPEPNH